CLLRDRGAAADLRRSSTSSMKSSDVAKLLLKANDNLERFLRMCAEIQGAFKQAQRNPRNVNFRLYNEWVDMFVDVLKELDPAITRRRVVELLSAMPETAGEFLPFINQELAGGYLN